MISTSARFFVPLLPTCLLKFGCQHGNRNTKKLAFEHRQPGIRPVVRNAAVSAKPRQVGLARPASCAEVQEIAERAEVDDILIQDRSGKRGAVVGHAFGEYAGKNECSGRGRRRAYMMSIPAVNMIAVYTPSQAPLFSAHGPPEDAAESTWAAR